MESERFGEMEGTDEIKYGQMRNTDEVTMSTGALKRADELFESQRLRVTSSKSFNMMQDVKTEGASDQVRNDLVLLQWRFASP